MTSPAETLREHIARAFVRNRIVDNMERWGRVRDEDSIQQAVDYAWTDFLCDADIALAAIEASGPDARMELAGGDALEKQYAANPRWETAKDVIEDLDVGAIFRAMLLAARTRLAGP